MAAKEQGKGVKVLGKKSLKSTRGGIIAVLKSGSAVGPEFGTSTDLSVRKAGEKPLEY